MSTSAGRAFAAAIAAKDADAVTALLTPDVDFRALTPKKFWEASEPGGVLDTLFGFWFEETDRIDELLSVEDGEAVEDTAQVSYRFAITNEDGPQTVEQTAYYRTEGDRISYLRVLCSGYRPVVG
jgi:ketosteroid isomerase-like protein